MAQIILTWKERYKNGASFERSVLDEIAELRAALLRAATSLADARRYRQMKENDFTLEYCAYITDRLNECEVEDLDSVLDRAANKEKA